MIARLIFLLAIIGIVPARAEVAWPETSLFYTAAEAQQIDATMATQGAAYKAMLHLDAIMYEAPERWVFWLNGRRRLPEDTDEHLRVLGVGKDQVHLSFDSNDIVLQPQQTYWLDKKTVTEGTR